MADPWDLGALSARESSRLPLGRREAAPQPATAEGERPKRPSRTGPDRRCLGLRLQEMQLGALEPRPIPRKVADLSLESSLFPGGPLHLSAASGLAAHGRRRFIVPDDGLHLAWYEDYSRPGKLVPLFDRPELPLDPDERKEVKPDLESLTLLSEGLLALGSGSKPNRRRGVFLPLGPGGEPSIQGRREVDLTPLYRELERSLPDLNIEGAAPANDCLRLVNRGNSSRCGNAVIDLDLEGVKASIREGRPLSGELIRAIRAVDLGTVPGPTRPVPFTFTDLVGLPDGRCVFTAAAEDTEDPVEDGKNLAAAVGILNPDGTVSRTYRLGYEDKIEGIHAELQADGGIRLELVTDSDRPEVPAEVLELVLPSPSTSTSPDT